MNKNYINGCLRWLANELAPYYDSEDLPENLRLKMSKFYQELNSSIDWYNLTKRDVQRLGFLNWEDDDSTGVWFIPCWLLPAIPEGMTLYDKNECQFEYHKSTACKDIMYGCLTFGIVLPPETWEEDL